MMLVTSNSSLTGAGPMMRGRVGWAEDFFLVLPIVQTTVPDLVAEDPRHAAQLKPLVLPQPPLEQQQQIGGRVALVRGVQVPLHLGQEPDLEAVSHQQLEVGRLVELLAVRLNCLDVTEVVVTGQLPRCLLGVEDRTLRGR